MLASSLPSGRWRPEAPPEAHRAASADAVGVVAAQGSQGADVRRVPRERRQGDAGPAGGAGTEPPRAFGRRLDQAPGGGGAVLVPEGRALTRLLVARLGRTGAEQAPVLRPARRPDRNARARHRVRRGLLLVRSRTARRTRG